MNVHCLLCGRELTPHESGITQIHPEADDCDVHITDNWGVWIDDDEPQASSTLIQGNFIDLKTYPFVEEILIEVFEEFGLTRLGGVSSGKGWSNFSLYQRCPYAWYRRHIVKAQPWIKVESPSLAIGTLVHAFLALYYVRMMTNGYAALTPEILFERLRRKANPDFVNEGWRVFQAYRLYYQNEVITPLAVEYDLKDPRTGESCRFDLIAYLEREAPGCLPGTYVIEHKTSAVFSHDTLEGWACDGEVLGQAALWSRLGLDKRFGELKGVMVNILGKHKEPKFHRTIVSPSTLQIQSHLDDLKRWDAIMGIAKSTNSFPRARQGCISKYGRCTEFDHCAGAD